MQREQKGGLHGEYFGKWLAALRIFVGIFFLNAGIPKLTPAFFRGMEGMLNAFAGGNLPMWYRAFLLNTAVPNAKLFAALVAIGEVAVGACLVLGLFTGLASLFGAIMTINYYLVTASAGPASQGLNLYATFVFIILLATHAGRTWGLDHWLVKKRQGWISW